jgi:hypothetical protein
MLNNVQNIEYVPETTPGDILHKVAHYANTCAILPIPHCIFFNCSQQHTTLPISNSSPLSLQGRMFEFDDNNEWHIECII